MSSHNNMSHGYRMDCHSSLAPGAAPMSMQHGCTFPSPPVPREYCAPAPFSSDCGNRYQKLVTGYGQSRAYGGGCGC